MPALIALSEIAPRWYEARFPYDKRLVEAFKRTPGCKWNPAVKAWTMPSHAIPALETSGAQFRFVKAIPLPTPTAIPTLLTKLRAYQQQGVERLVASPGYVLGWGMRVGKTPTAAIAAAHMLNDGGARSVLVLAPNGVKREWLRQFPQFTGLPIYNVEGVGGLGNDLPALMNSHANPYLVMAMSFELLTAEKQADGSLLPNQTYLDVCRVLSSRMGPYVLIGDELHEIRERKKPRAQLLLSLAANPSCTRRWALTGTPLRNYPADMFVLWNFIQPESMGSWSKFTTRYAEGHMGTHGWKADGRSNEDELNARLAAVCWRLSRQEVAPWLPKADRKVVLCDMTQEQARVYRKQEAALGTQALAAMQNNVESTATTAALKQLATLTTASKIPTAIARARYHVEERSATEGRAIKVVIFAYHHETLGTIWDEFEKLKESKRDKFEAPVFVAGGWMLADKRAAQIEKWKQTPGSAVLLANALSSGRGIDLADAEASIFVELTWVPADFLQAESRIEDVHLGKRSTPPLMEYVLTRGTVDEDMARLLIEKIAATESVVGTDEQTRGVHATLRESGVVDRSVLSLTREDPETVAGALDAMRARLFGEMELNAPGEDSENNSGPEEDDEDEEKEDEDA